MFRKLKRILVRAVHIALGKDILIKKQIDTTFEICGTEYGGYPVILEKLPVAPIIYSFGIGEDISFELSILSVSQGQLFAFDPTPKTICYMKTQAVPESFHFYPVAISNTDGELSFFFPENENYVSCTAEQTTKLFSKQSTVVQGKRITTIMEELGHKNIDVLKMDIEGSEFEVVCDMLNENVFTNQLLLEIHHRFIANGVDKLKNMLQKLKENGYKLFYISSTGEVIGLTR